MNEIERDREIDAAWREASREEPPPALDDAIRAEARRAADAGPVSARRRTYRQLRYPFAAAATVALLAFGIARMTPPDQLSPMLVTDQPAASREAAPRERLAQAPEPNARTESGAAETTTPATPPSQAKSAQPTLQQKPSRGPADAAVKKDQASESVAMAPAPSTSEPFPGSAASGAVAADAPARNAASVARPSPSEPPRDVREMAPAPERRDLATAPVAVAKVSNLDEMKAREAGAESVEAWIARIRALRAAGQLDDAAKELARFRAAYGERAEDLLPRDLRALSSPPARP